MQLHNEKYRVFVSHWFALLALCAAGAILDASGREFSIKQLADEKAVNREPVINEQGLAVWVQITSNEVSTSSDIVIYENKVRRNLTSAASGLYTANNRPHLQGTSLVWLAHCKSTSGPTTWTLRQVANRGGSIPELRAKFKVSEKDGVSVIEPMEDPTGPDGLEMKDDQEDRRGSGGGANELVFWKEGMEPIRITTDSRDDLHPSCAGSLLAWQTAKGWPFGWEIMAWDNGEFVQLTTNYYYDMAPVVQGRQIVWYGYDGYDYEIFLYDADKKETVQITSNRYEDVSPQSWDGLIAWEGSLAADSDIFIYQNGEIKKISDNPEDDINPRVWKNFVVWQGFDGDDFEIYLYDGERTTKLTSNLYDDANPEIRDGLIIWTGYVDNWDAEIFAWIWPEEQQPVRLTDNDYEDRTPQTAGGRVIWQADHDGKSEINLAEPK